MKSFVEYQTAAWDLALPTTRKSMHYGVLGLVGEAGEVAEKFKKIIRDDNDVISEEQTQAIGKELGDVLWYVADVCTKLGLSMEDVATMNIEKLQDRARRGVRSGSGDDR
jgi:NTP pyrophosphatase (non-canonical NTP hydrolase)